MSDSIAIDLYKQGEARGEARGEAKGKAEDIVKILRTKPDAKSMDKSLINKIKSIKDIKLLDKIFDYALIENTVHQFSTKFNTLYKV